MPEPERPKRSRRGGGKPVFGQLPEDEKKKQQSNSGCSCLVLLVIAVAIGWFVTNGFGTQGNKGPWTLDAAMSTMAEAGFSGKESSPLADGTPRTTMRGPNSSAFEATGDPSSLKSVSLMLAVTDTTDDSEALLTFLRIWAPASADFVSSALANTLFSDVSSTRAFDGYVVEIQSLGATDGVILIISVTRA